MYQQQGRYMAAVRQLPKAARAKIKAVREKSGVRAAIAAAKRMGEVGLADWVRWGLRPPRIKASRALPSAWDTQLRD
jgi:hypothetical protein